MDEDIEQAKNYFFKGISCFENQKYEESEINYRLALQLVPHHLGILTNLTTALIKLKK